MFSLIEARMIGQIQGIVTAHQPLVLLAVFFARWLILLLVFGLLIAYFLPKTKSWQKHWLKESGWSILLACVSAITIASLLHRVRPFLAFPRLVTVLVPMPGSYFSFPSAHSAAAAAFAFSAQRIWPKQAVVLWVLAGCVMIGRVLVGVHYLTDVMAGALVGCAAAALVQWLHDTGKQRLVPSL